MGESPGAATRWIIGDYRFDADTRRLRGAGGEALLEPKAAALLAYFCEHPGRSIGRDELLEAVWRGQVVSDNSINRVVVLLRKALKDDDKARRYIATVPKLGYRLIAPVRVFEAGQRDAFEGVPSSGVFGTGRASLALAVVALVAIAVYLGRGAPPGAPEQAGPAVAPLSRLAVAQSNAALAADGQSLLFTASDGRWRQVFLVTDAGAPPQAISAPDGHADFAAWAHNDAFVVYRFAQGERCEFHRVERARLTDRSPEVIYECVPGSYSELSLSPDNSTLYFVERPAEFAPYAVYALNLEQQSKQRLSQPVAAGYGNHFVDVHPTSGALLVLGDRTPGKTSVYQLDPVGNSFTLRRAFDFGLDSAIWSHRDGYIVHPSRHPSYQLVESPLDGGAERTIVSDSRRISGPRRIDAPQSAGGYLFTSYLYNRDIDIGSPGTSALNSAVMDYLPALDNRGQRLAFISKRAGYSQVWIKDLRDGQLAAIEPPDAGRRFLSLAWSADDRRLLANTNTGVLVYSLVDGAYQHNISLPLPAYAVHWHDAQTLSFSHFEGQRFRAYRHELATGETVALDERWAFSLGNQQQQLYFDQSLQAHRDGRPLTELAACADPVWRYQLRYLLDGEHIYCHAQDAYRDLLRFDAQMNVTRLPDAVDRYEFFSARDGQLATTRVASEYSDIMRTRRVD